MHQLPELNMEEEVRFLRNEVIRLRGEIGILMQTQRLFAQALGVHDQFDLIVQSLQRPSVPGAE